MTRSLLPAAPPAANAPLVEHPPDDGSPSSTSSPRPPVPPANHLCGRWVRLERLSRRHIPALHAIATADDVIDGWPLGGRRLEPPQFEAHLWRQSQVQLAIVRRDTDATIGLVQAVNGDLRSGLADVAVTVAPDLWRAGWPLEAVVLFDDYLFDDLGYRKLYFTMTASVRAQLGRGVETLLTLEATLERHVRARDGLEDLLIFAVQRDQRDNPVSRMLRGRI
jgi:RimJ/RimL family protein N-acetyltransferase